MATVKVTPDVVHTSEECFSNSSTTGLVFAHRILSNHDESGFHALLIFDSKSPLPEGASLAPMIVEDYTCHVQICPPMDTFYKHSTVPEHLKMSMTIQNYLDFYTFVHCKWPLVFAQMVKNAKAMVSGKEWIRINPRLVFLNDGVCNYRVLLGKDLIFSASIDSKNVIKKAKATEDSKNVIKNETEEIPIEFFVQASIQIKDKKLDIPMATISRLFQELDTYQHIKTAYLLACKRKRPPVQF